MQVSLEQYIAAKAGEILGTAVESAQRLENVPNNTIYILSTQRGRFIFKLYSKKVWPEDGKLSFIDQLLTEHCIPHAKLLEFDRSDPQFPNGYSIEEYLPGVLAETLPFDADSGAAFYRDFAILVRLVHEIPMRGYGYIGGSGTGCYDEFCDYIDDVMTENAEKAFKIGLPEIHMLWALRERVVERLELCRGLPSVLCHGDLSEKNVIVGNEGGLTLIDWDDTMAQPWVFDIARMTFQMKMRYDREAYSLYRDVFLDTYGGDRALFDKIEPSLHSYFKLDFEVYDYERTHR